MSTTVFFPTNLIVKCFWFVWWLHIREFVGRANISPLDSPCRGGATSPALLIICYLTVYQSQKILSRLCDCLMTPLVSRGSLAFIDRMITWQTRSVGRVRGLWVHQRAFSLRRHGQNMKHHTDETSYSVWQQDVGSLSVKNKYQLQLTSDSFIHLFQHQIKTKVKKLR